MEDLQTIDASELGKLLGRSTKSIKVDVTRRPDTLPPRFIVPGTRLLRWRVVDVRRWMQALAKLEEDRRVAAAAFAQRVGIPSAPSRAIGHLGNVATGLRATEAMKAQG